MEILFRQITTFVKVHVGFDFWPNILQLIDFSKIYQLKRLKLRKKGRMNFYEHCDLTEKKYTRYITHASNTEEKTPCRNAIKVFMSICTIS